MGLLGSIVGAVFTVAFVDERKKRRFVATVAGVLAARVDDVESGDLVRPLSFKLGSVHVHAAVRGDVEVWQLEDKDGDAGDGIVAVVYAGWRAPDARALSPIAEITPRLHLFADDEAKAHTLLARSRTELAYVLGRGTRRAIVGGGRAFLEVTRRGYLLDELADALARFDAVRAVVAGRRPSLPSTAPSSERAVGGPAGVPIPAV